MVVVLMVAEVITPERIDGVLLGTVAMQRGPVSETTERAVQTSVE